MFGRETENNTVSISVFSIQLRLLHTYDMDGSLEALLHLENINLLKSTGYVMHQQFNIQQLYALPTLYLCVLYLSENKQRLVPLIS